MNKKHWYNIKEIILITSIWIVITFFYVFIKFNDIPEAYLSEIYGGESRISIEWIYRTSFFVSLPLGIVLGILYTYVYPHLYRSKGFVQNLFIRFVIFFIVAISIFFCLYRTTDLSLILNGNKISILIYMIVSEIVIGLLILTRRNLGDNYFVNTILNTYRNPKGEERVFMFLDMQDSTPTAEQLGYLTFSRYMQDCFYYLSDVVLKNGGEIYQFVGDEAVITWRVKNNFDDKKCLDLYFDYADYLKKKEEYFKTHYNIVPVFKCGIHRGVVSTALVGDYKKEIAYHGDVLNLCSRLQVFCKKTEHYVIISETFYRLTENSENYNFIPVSINNLKGIHGEQKCFYVAKKESNRPINREI